MEYGKQQSLQRHEVFNGTRRQSKSLSVQAEAEFGRTGGRWLQLGGEPFLSRYTSGSSLTGFHVIVQVFSQEREARADKSADFFQLDK